EVTGQVSGWFFQKPWPSGQANVTGLGVMATPSGKCPTGTVATTVLVAVSITDTVPSPTMTGVVTYAWVPSGVMATPSRNPPTGPVAATVWVAVSITETLLKTPGAATYAWVPSGVMATPPPLKEKNTGTVATTVLVAVAITDTVSELVLVTYA